MYATKFPQSSNFKYMVKTFLILNDRLLNDSLEVLDADHLLETESIRKMCIGIFSLLEYVFNFSQTREDLRELRNALYCHYESSKISLCRLKK